MQSEKAMNEKPMATTQEKVLSRTIKEITPFGVRIELNLEGRVSGELYSAQHMETVSIFQKTDGTFENEARAIETTKDGDVLVISFKGTGKQTGLTTLWGEGEGIIMTQSKKLSKLNGAKIRTVVNADYATGEVQVNFFET
ncbi:MAG: hypothetical protein OK456_08370 [Thaumarchaeota archaeon]|nr:hypothetical protein [Nitrososphaerota archaeon]